MRTGDGESVPLVAEEGADYSPRISPDGSQLLYLAGRAGVKLYSFAEGKTTQILPGVAVAVPRWSPGGDPDCVRDSRSECGSLAFAGGRVVPKLAHTGDRFTGLEWRRQTDGPGGFTSG